MFSFYLKGTSQKNSGLEVFCDKISGYIKNAYTKHETCKKGKEKEIELKILFLY